MLSVFRAAKFVGVLAACALVWGVMICGSGCSRADALAGSSVDPGTPICGGKVRVNFGTLATYGAVTSATIAVTLPTGARPIGGLATLTGSTLTDLVGTTLSLYAQQGSEQWYMMQTYDVWGLGGFTDGAIGTTTVMDLGGSVNVTAQSAGAAAPFSTWGNATLLVDVFYVVIN